MKTAGMRPRTFRSANAAHRMTDAMGASSIHFSQAYDGSTAALANWRAPTSA